MLRLHHLSPPPLASAGCKQPAQNISNIRSSSAVVTRLLFCKNNSDFGRDILRTTTRPISPVRNPYTAIATSLCSLPRESAASTAASSSFTVGPRQPEKDPEAIEREKKYGMPYRISLVLLYVLSFANCVVRLSPAFDVSSVSIMVGKTPLLVKPSAVDSCVLLMWSFGVPFVIC